MDTHAVLCDTYMTQMMMLGNPYHNAELSKMAVNGVVYPRTFYMDLDDLRLWAEWHEVRRNSCSLAWKHTDVGILQAPPGWMGGNAPIIEEGTRWVRTSPPSRNA
jgi:hypothetical protein